MKLLFLPVLVLLAGVAAYVPALSDSGPSPKEPVWAEVYQSDRSQTVYFNKEKHEGDVISGHMLVVYHTPKMYSGKTYTSRVTGVSINCKQSVYVTSYDLYYQKKFPGLYDNAIGGVQYDLNKVPLVRGDRNLVYQSFCSPVV